jgi:hypothetical protein
MTCEAAEQEALLYIRKGQMWIHGVTQSDGSTGISSICAVTRISSQVARITKVCGCSFFNRSLLITYIYRFLPTQLIAKWAVPNVLYELFADSVYLRFSIISINSYLCSYLHVEGKESLVLYAAHDNPAARSVYRRVGFRGLDDRNEEVPGVERWLELGFDRQTVSWDHSIAFQWSS